MYPTVVILLVETQRSMMDVCEISSLNATILAGPLVSEACPASGHLSFAVRPLRSTTDNEAGSQRSRALQSQGGHEHSLEEIILEVKESRVGTSS
jgi:hypothetical protein